MLWGNCQDTAEAAPESTALVWGQAVPGLWGWGAQTLPVSWFAAMCCSFVQHHQDQAERGCSKRERGDAAPGPPTAVGHNLALPLAGGIKTGGCIKHHRAPATWKISFQINFQSHCASILTMSSNTLSPHILQTGLWAVITALCPVPSPHVPCDNLLGPLSPLPPAGTKSLPLQLQSSHAVGLAAYWEIGSSYSRYAQCPAQDGAPLSWLSWMLK